MHFAKTITFLFKKQDEKLRSNFTRFKAIDTSIQANKSDFFGKFGGRKFNSLEINRQENNFSDAARKKKKRRII